RLAVSRKNFIVFSYQGPRITTIVALWSAKWDALGALVSEFIDGGNGVIHAGAIRGVDKRIRGYQAIRCRFEFSIGAVASKDSIAGQVRFRIRGPGEKSAVIRRDHVESGRRPGRSFVVGHDCN